MAGSRLISTNQLFSELLKILRKGLNVIEFSSDYANSREIGATLCDAIVAEILAYNGISTCSAMLIMLSSKQFYSPESGHDV